MLALFAEFDARIWEADGCAPLVLTGARRAAVRGHLTRRTVALSDQLSRNRHQSGAARFSQA